ncbi:hypothetical protein ACHAXN_009240 [Cyclotella atomus]
MAKRTADDMNTVAETVPSEIPARTIDGYQWVEIIKYLDADDLKSLRLASNKALRFHNPIFTSHLPLRMDLVPFFGKDSKYTANQMKLWLCKRKRLLIRGRTKIIQYPRVASLIKAGFMNSITDIEIANCSGYKYTIEHLAKLPNLKHLKLVDRYPYLERIDQKGKVYDIFVKETSEIVNSLADMTGLESLDIEFDCIVNGSHLSILQNMKCLRSLRLRGFDFSQGIEHIRHLTKLENLHLCHGNTYLSANGLVPLDAFHSLTTNLENLKSIHIESMDSMPHDQIKPLTKFESVTELTFKHCQGIKGEVLSSIGTMTQLRELHFVYGIIDKFDDFESEDLVHLQNLKKLKVLTLMYVMIDQYDLLDLEGMDELETLNIGLVAEMTEKGFHIMLKTLLPLLPSLKKVRIFGSSPEDVQIRYQDIDIDFCSCDYFDDMVDYR